MKIDSTPVARPRTSGGEMTCTSAYCVAEKQAAAPPARTSRPAAENTSRCQDRASMMPSMASVPR